MIETSTDKSLTEKPPFDTRFLMPPPAPAFRPGVILWRALRDNLNGILIWGAAYSALIVTVVILFPILREGDTLVGVLTGLGFLEVIASNYAINAEALGTFPGYLAFQAMGWAPHILAVYIVPHAIRALMNEETEGTLDLLLGTPITRWQLFLEKTLAIVLSLVGILAIMWGVLVASTALAGIEDFSIRQATIGIWHIFPIGMVQMSVALLLSVILRNPRTVGGLAALYIASSYFVRSLAEAADTPFLHFLSRFSVYEYYSSINAMTDGIRWVVDFGLLAIALGLILLAMWFFQRRDLGI